MPENSRRRRRSMWPVAKLDGITLLKQIISGNNLGLLRRLSLELLQDSSWFCQPQRREHPFNGAQSQVGKFKRILQLKVRSFSHVPSNKLRIRNCSLSTYVGIRPFSNRIYQQFNVTSGMKYIRKKTRQQTPLTWSSGSPSRVIHRAYQRLWTKVSISTVWNC